MQNNARSWFNLGLFQIQPSEFAKLSLIVAMAAWLAERKGDVRWIDLGLCLAMVGVLAALIFVEPDLGGTMVIVAILLVMLLVGGAKLRHFIALGLIGTLGDSRGISDGSRRALSGRTHHRLPRSKPGCAVGGI